jgi:hypothetical protein
MLQEVNKSLSHAIRAQQQQNHVADVMQIKGDLGVKPELSKSSPNLVDKAPGMGRPQKRFGYNQRAMAQIKQSLAGFQISGESRSILRNGYDLEVTPINQHMLRQLTLTGCDEVSGNVMHVLSICHLVSAPENVVSFYFQQHSLAMPGGG